MRAYLYGGGKRAGFAALLGLLVAVAAWVLAAGTAGAEPKQTIVGDTFNSQSTGAAPAGWTLEDVTGGTATVQEVPSATDKSVRLTDTSTANPVIVNKSFTAPSGVVTVEFDIRPAQTGTFIAAGYAMDISGKRSASVHFNHTTNEIQAYNGSAVEVVQPYSANTWYRMKYVIDTHSAKYDVYVDGALKKSGLAFREAAAAVSSIQFFVGGSTAGTVYFDNVNVQTGGMVKPSTNRVFEQYDGAAAGSAPAGWTMTDLSGGTAVVDNVPSAADKSVKLNDTSTASPVIITRAFTAVSGKLTVEFDMMAPQTNALLAAGYPLDGAGNKTGSLYFDSDGVIKAYDGSGTVTIQPYQANVWYRIKYVLNTSSGKYDVYVDGRLKQADLGFRSSVSSFSQIQFFVGTPATGTLYFDNLNVSAEGELASASYGSAPNATGDRIGGGEGYRRLVASGTYTVSTAAGLINALNSAQSGDIVYVADSAVISFPASSLPLEVKGGVTLASGRGKIINGSLSLGAKLTTTATGVNLIKVTGNNVRITGLRLDGQDYAVGTDPYNPAVTHGINTESFGTTEVDNNEIMGWTWGGIVMNDGYVHHNDIHHNQRTGLGYGVVQKHSAANGIVIEGNRFDYNRHDIASTGEYPNRYEAKYNTSVHYRVGHAFDMHGNTACSCAGDWMKIHHNTFQDTAGKQGIVIREVPVTGAYINNNWFYDTDWSYTILQRVDYGHMYVGTNKYGTGSSIQYLTGKYGTSP